MRNWNAKNAECFVIINPVVPYLWGIETDVTIKITAPALCCTLPMRNWNTIEGSLYVIQNLFRCTLPMRNWNLEDSSSSSDPVVSCTLPMRNWNKYFNKFFWGFPKLYLTYEELKLLLGASVIILLNTSLVVPYLWGIETVIYGKIQNL